jgi:hypothetical protein
MLGTGTEKYRSVNAMDSVSPLILSMILSSHSVWRRPSAFLGFKFMGLPFPEPSRAQSSCHVKMQPIISLSQAPPSGKRESATPPTQGVLRLGWFQVSVIRCFSRFSLIRTLSFFCVCMVTNSSSFGTCLIKGVCVISQWPERCIMRLLSTHKTQS